MIDKKHDLNKIDDSKYKVEKYQVSKSRGEYRYRIVDAKSNKVIDDAQGYGFKTSKKAFACLYYKINKNEIEAKKNEYRKILDEISPKLKEFDWILEDITYLKDGDYDHDNFVDFWNAVLEKYPELEKYNTKHFNNYLKNNL